MSGWVRLPRKVASRRNPEQRPAAAAKAASLAPHAARFGLPKGAGLELLGWFLDLASDPEKERWIDEARAHVDRAAGMKT